MDLNVFKADQEKEVNGVWTEIEFRGQTGMFKIARAGNPKFTRLYTKYKNQKQFVNGESQEALDHEQDCLNRAFAEAILLDTGDEITDNGEPVKYTNELGYRLMSDPALTELKNQIAMKAGDFENYAIIKLEDIAKN